MSYLEYRERIVRQALSDNNLLMVPDGLMICYHMGNLTVCQRTALDRRMDHMRTAAGFHFSHHWLRRAFGRGMWLTRNIPLETIAQMMGHTSTAMTTKYLRINLDDQADAMEKYYNFQLRIRAEKKNTKTLINKKMH